MPARVCLGRQADESDKDRDSSERGAKGIHRRQEAVSKGYDEEGNDADSIEDQE